MKRLRRSKRHDPKRRTELMSGYRSQNMKSSACGARSLMVLKDALVWQVALKLEHEEGMVHSTGESSNHSHLFETLAESEQVLFKVLT